jgi:hypothetical protein
VRVLVHQFIYRVEVEGLERKGTSQFENSLNPLLTRLSGLVRLIGNAVVSMVGMGPEFGVIGVRAASLSQEGAGAPGPPPPWAPLRAVLHRGDIIPMLGRVTRL